MSLHDHPYNVIITLKRFETPLFLSSMMPNSNTHREKRDSPDLSFFHFRHKYLKNSFFLHAIVKYNKSSSFIQNCGLHRVFN